MFDAGGVLDGAAPLSKQQILEGQRCGYIPQGRTVYQLGDEDLAWSSEGDVIDKLNDNAQDQRVLKNGKMILEDVRLDVSTKIEEWSAKVQNCFTF